MKKGIIVLLAVCACTAIVKAGDINPAYGTAAGGLSTQPANIVGGDAFKKLREDCDAVLNYQQRLYISEDNIYWYTYPNDGDKTWAYLIVKFAEDSVPLFAPMTCYWKAYSANSSVACTCWRWDNRPIGEGGQRFVHMSTGDTGTSPSTKSFDVNSGWWTYDDTTEKYQFFLLIQAHTASGARWLKVNVCDIHY
jgi:hypothetical protein